ncbi:MAG TPA: YceI family protein [Polyangiaceae bacterium]|jgi:polyisoprenoid-binding protein YceI
MATYDVDRTHSEISFTVRHMVFAKVRGQFKDWEAKLTYDPVDPSKSSLRVEVATASIDTREAKRDEHLRSGDFFESEKYPSMVFVSKRVQPAGAGKYTVLGDLTLHGVTKEISLEVEETGRGKDPWGNSRLGFSAKGALNRSDFGLKWNQALETGGMLVSDKVEIEVETQVVEHKAAAA